MDKDYEDFSKIAYGVDSYNDMIDLTKLLINEDHYLSNESKNYLKKLAGILDGKASERIVTFLLKNTQYSKMKKIGYTTGVFDLFHIGHLNILKRARLECDHLIVGITTDELAEKAKSQKPFIPFQERMDLVESVKYVDEVVPQTSYDKMEAWNNLKFDLMFVGDDWKGTEQWINIEKDFSKVGVEIIYFPYTTHTSSTILRKILSKQ